MNICFSISIAQHGEIIMIINSSSWSQNLSLRVRVNRVTVLRVRVLKSHCSYCSWPTIASIDFWSCFFKSALWENLSNWIKSKRVCLKLSNDWCKVSKSARPNVTSAVMSSYILLQLIFFQLLDWIETSWKASKLQN